MIASSHAEWSNGSETRPIMRQLFIDRLHKAMEQKMKEPSQALDHTAESRAPQFPESGMPSLAPPVDTYRESTP
jgi:hypothetical protein